MKIETGEPFFALFRVFDVTASKQEFFFIIKVCDIHFIARAFAILSIRFTFVLVLVRLINVTCIGLLVCFCYILQECLPRLIFFMVRTDRINSID